MSQIFRRSAVLSLLVAIILTLSGCPRPQDDDRPRKSEYLLSPPIVNPPLYQCGTAVTVKGFVPGATIDIFADGATHIGGGVSDAPWGQSFSIIPDMVAGQKITATQTYGGVTSQPSDVVEVVDYFYTHPEGLSKPNLDEPIYNCGGALGVRNLVEGGRLKVYADNNQVGSTNGCGSGQWLSIHPNFTTGQKVIAVETLCNIVGPKSDEVAVQTEPSSLPALSVGDVYEGGTYVNVYNITNGALVTVYEGIQQVAGHYCSGGGQVFRLNPAPQNGDVLTADQRLCDKISDPSDPIVVLPCKDLPAPTVHAVCIDDTYITVSGHAPDAQIRIYGDNNLIGNGGGNNIVPVTPLVVGMVITATQSLGDCVSPASSPTTVATFVALPYDPDAWNDPNWVRCNNCYNYACDIRTDNFAQPGHAHGAYPYSVPNCQEVSAGALADGLVEALKKVCDGCTTHRVALVVDNEYPNYDYHWYRLDDNGNWSGKSGGTPATNLDASGNIITNPETADRHYSGPDYDLNYHRFCGYYCVNKDIVVISGPRDCN